MTLHAPHPPDIGGQPSAPRTFDMTVRHGGRQFVATRTMAAIFAARAEDVVGRHDTELVPLLHRDGVELLLISPQSVFSVRPIEGGVGHQDPRA